MQVFGTTKRGCYFAALSDATEGGGTYLKLPDGTQIAGKAKNQVSDTIVTRVDINYQERYQILPCFQNTIHMFTFGHDAEGSIITLSGIVFLTGKSGTAYADSQKVLNASYNKNRVSVTNKQAELYLADKLVAVGPIISMNSSTMSEEYQLQGFTIKLAALEIT